MRNKVYLTIGALCLVSFVISFFVLKVFASENLVYVESCTPYNVKIQKGDEENTIKIMWQTRDKCSGYILYGSQMKELNMVGVDLESEVFSKKHDVYIKGLVSSKRYYLTIMSDDISYGKNGLPIQFSIDSL